MLRAFISLILLLMVQTCYAFNNEPNGFRGLTWGMPIETIIKSKAVKPTILSDQDIDVPASFLGAETDDIGNAAVKWYAFRLNNQNLNEIPISMGAISLKLQNNRLYRIELELGSYYDAKANLPYYHKMKSIMTNLYGNCTSYKKHYHANNCMGDTLIWSGKNTEITLSYCSDSYLHPSVEIILESKDECKRIINELKQRLKKDW